MNTRGLMELVVLNIGYDLGILTPEIFAMMVIMALVTTFMTGPALDLIEWSFKKIKSNTIQTEDSNKFRILLSFGNNEGGKNLLQIANSFVKKMNNNAEISALHLEPTNEIHQFNIKELEKEIMTPIIETARQLKQPIKPIFKASNDINSDIIEEANTGEYDLLLVGIGQSMYEGSFLGKVLGFTTRIMNPELLKKTLTGKEKLFNNTHFDERTREILFGSKIPTGIFIEKNFKDITHVIIPFICESDVRLVTYFQKLINNTEALITLIDINGFIKNNEELSNKLALIQDYVPDHLQILSEWEIEKKLIGNYDLMLVSLEGWESLQVEDEEWLNHSPSTLILRP